MQAKKVCYSGFFSSSFFSSLFAGSGFFLPLLAVDAGLASVLVAGFVSGVADAGLVAGAGAALAGRDAAFSGATGVGVFAGGVAFTGAAAACTGGLATGGAGAFAG